MNRGEKSVPASEVKLNQACPCGSKLMAKVCCYPVKPPIEMAIPPFVREAVVNVSSPSMDAILASNAPEPVKRIVKSMSSFTVTQTYSQDSGPGLLSKEQANPYISTLLRFAPDGYHLDSPRFEAQLMARSHSVKYHQQQCMYRIFKLQRQAKKQARNSQQQLGPKQVRMLQVVQFEDLPLRAEFEAFSNRIASTLDATAKYVCDCLGKNKKKYGKHFELLNHLREHQDNAPVFVALRNIYSQNEAWSASVIRGLRHVIMHEGTLWSLEPSKNMSNEVPFVPPSNSGQRIDELCLKHWTTLTYMISSIRTALVTHELTE